MKRLTYFLATFCIALSTTGCTDNTDTNGNGNTEIISISSSLDQIAVGEGAIFYFDFDFDENEVYFDGGVVNIVVRVPPELSYLLYSAEIDENGSNDNSVNPYVLTCGDGSSYLAFSLDDNDLDEAYSPDDSEAQLKLTLTGRRKGTFALVQAVATDTAFTFGCNQPFTADSALSVVVY